MQKTLEMMNQMLQVQIVKDWIMLADILEYEVFPLLVEWKEILSILNKKSGNYSHSQAEAV